MPKSLTAKGTSRAKKEESNDISSYKSKPMTETNGVKTTPTKSATKKKTVSKSPTAKGTSSVHQKESNDISSYKSKPTPETNGVKATPKKAATKKKTVSKTASYTPGSVRVSIKNNDIDLDTIGLLTPASTTLAKGAKRNTGAKRKKTPKKVGKGFSKQ